MQTNQVLDVREIPDRDRIGVPTHHGSKKNRARAAYRDVSANGGVWRDVAIRANQILPK
jgi:hypothetical protein